jgi:parvulin-like peptidyl-prolyl isomerase
MADRTGVRRWVRRAVVGAAAVAGLGVVVAQPPAKLPPGVPATSESTRTVATIDTAGGRVAITQEEFGKFLTDRGGADKLELFVNKRIIEAEAARLGLTVTTQEMEAALKQDMEGITVKYDEFVKIVLPKYGKTLYEWMEDVVRPRLLLGKMCKDEVKVEEADLKVQYERLYGEKRRIQMVLYPPADQKTAEKLFAQARTSQDEFDSVARSQPNPSLAAAKGFVAPISRHLPGEDKAVENVAFKLKAGEVSEMLKTAQGFVFIKLHEVIPPNPNTTFEKEKDRLFAAAYDEKLQLHIPKKFAELKKRAQPEIVYMPPKEWQAITPAAGLGGIVNPGGK